MTLHVNNPAFSILRSLAYLTLYIDNQPSFHSDIWESLYVHIVIHINSTRGLLRQLDSPLSPSADDKWHEDDALILRVIEAYCTSAKTRYTINSSKCVASPRLRHCSWTSCEISTHSGFSPFFPVFSKAVLLGPSFSSFFHIF